jgi:hypothetical protein
MASPYFLVYGSEVVLPTDVMWHSPMVDQYEECVAEETRQTDVNSLEEARCNALVQSARYLEKIRHYHDHNVKERSFNVGDLVLRSRQGYTNSTRHGKVLSLLRRLPVQARIVSKLLKVRKSTTLGTSTSFVTSTHRGSQ